MSESPPLACVSPDKIDAVWPIVEPMIRSAYEAGDEIMPDDLVDWLKAGKGLLWLCIRENKVIAAMTTSLERKRSGLCCRMVCCGGVDMNYWRACEDRIVEYARAEGCVKVRVEGRVGWARVLPGYKVERVHLEKAI